MHISNQYFIFTISNNNNMKNLIGTVLVVVVILTMICGIISFGKSGHDNNVKNAIECYNKSAVKSYEAKMGCKAKFNLL